MVGEAFRNATLHARRLTPDFTDECEVWRQTSLSDGIGGSINSHSLVATYNVAWRDAIEKQESIVADGIVLRITTNVIFSFDANIKYGDILRVAGRELKAVKVLKKNSQTSMEVKCV